MEARRPGTKKPSGLGTVIWILLGTGFITILEAKSGRGFWLGRYQLDQVHIDQKWQVANHEAITGYLTVTHCLVLAYNIWPEYERWTYVNGLDRQRGVGHARQAVEADLLPPKRIINLNILGSENPPQEDWDYYNRYVGPNQQAKARARAAAPTPVGGAATVQPAVTKASQQPVAPKQPAVPPAGWQPTLRSAQQSVQQAEHSSAHTSSSVRTPPTPKPVQGVAAPKGRGITVTSAEGPVSAPPSVVAKAVPKVEPVVAKSLPEPKQSQGVAVPKERDTAVVTSEESSTAYTTGVVPKVSQSKTVVQPLLKAELPSPPVSAPPSPLLAPPSSIPPPPQHPPPTLEVLAAQASSVDQAREAVVENQDVVEEFEEVEFQAEEKQHLVKPLLPGKGIQRGQ